MTETVVTKPANKIRDIRIDKKVTARQLADECRVTETTIYRWQSGENEPTVAQMHTLATFLGCTLDELFPREEKTA